MKWELVWSSISEVYINGWGFFLLMVFPISEINLNFGNMHQELPHQVI